MRIHRLGELSTSTIGTDNTVPDLSAALDEEAEFAGGTQPESPVVDAEDLEETIEAAGRRQPLVQRFLEWVTGSTAIVASGDVDEEAATVERQSPFHDNSKPSEQDGYYYYGEDVVTSAKLD